MSEHIIEAANQPPLKVPMCYSINQIEVIQTLGNHTLASQNDADEFLQKIIKLIKKPDTTKSVAYQPHELGQQRILLYG